MARISDQQRAAILQDVQAGTKSCRQIAKDHGVSQATVSELAKAEGITDAFNRAQTEKATAARAADCRARREALKEALLDDAEKLRQRAWSPYEIVVDNRNTGPQHITLDLPPLQDVRAAYNAISLAIDKSVKLEQYDATGGDVDAKSMLGALAEGIRQYAQATEPEGDTGD